MATIDLSGKEVIVTGASSGIGEATARALHKTGAHPVLAARRGDRLKKLSDELEGALAVPTDVTKADERQAIIEQTLGRHGRIDGLVNNAGIGMHKLLVDTDLDEFTHLLQLNVVAALGMMQAVIPAMHEHGHGRIVNVSSGTTRMAAPTVSAYGASKAALNMISAVGRVELAQDGIVVSMVRPSVTATEFDGSVQARRRGGARPDRAELRLRRPVHPAGTAHRRGSHRHPARPRTVGTR